MMPVPDILPAPDILFVSRYFRPEPIGSVPCSTNVAQFPTQRRLKVGGDAKPRKPGAFMSRLDALSSQR
jgi:hypothetical protein